YGLGAVAVARALEALDPWGFGVATSEEAAELRRAGIARPVIVFTPWTPRGASPESRVDGVRDVIGDIDSLEAWLTLRSSELETRDSRLFHLEIDTGMARSGIRWDDRGALQSAAVLLERSGEGWEGVFTHFHSADTDGKGTELQWERLQSALSLFPRRPKLIHASGSAAALRGPRFAGDLVRPGIFLYGGGVGEWAPAPRAVARLRAPVVALRELPAGEGVSYGATWRAERATRIATLAYGYADGMLRSASNRAEVELGGLRRPVRGRVTMDMTMVEAGPDVRVGEVATVFGGGISVDAHAAALGTISYEVLTAIGPRVPRVYV
ncbi:MAG TPA: alanine racemase, partial [Gemmatimonadales bacterium]|nr:alanine racemase [Gemmatimonadales bacterium]